MAESRRRKRTRNAQPEGQSQPELADGEFDSTSAQIADATTGLPAAEKDAIEESRSPEPEDAVGVNVDIDINTIPVKKSETGGSSVQESSNGIDDLFQPREFVEQVAAAMFTDSKGADRLLSALSERLRVRIEDDPEFKRKLLTCAIANPEFRGKVIKALAKAMR